MRLVMKCVYCGERVVVNLDREDNKLVLSAMRSKELFVCRKCANNKETRIWLSQKILGG